MNKKSINKVWPDLIIIFTLFISGLKYIHGIEKSLDIRLYDESNYLWGGVTLFKDISVAGTVAEKTQVYSFWYYLLSLVEPDRVSLYFLNYWALTVLLPITLYIVLRRYKVNILASTIVCFFFLISDVNLGVWPKVGHFALMIVLISFILASLTKSQTMRITIICLGSLLSSYVRPEFFIIFVFFLFILAGTVFIEFKNQSYWTFAVLLGSLLFAVIFINQLGLPIAGTRSFGAFGQHFSLNWVQWENNEELSNWTDWETIINRNFGDVDDITGAFFNNPRVFIKHILSNLTRFPKSIIERFFVHANLIMPTTSKNLEAILLLGLLTFTFLWSIIKRPYPFISHMEEKKNLLLYGGPYLIVSMISILIIFPRDHYLLLPGILITIMAMIFLTRGETISETKLSKLMLLFLCAIIIFITPSFTSLIESSGKKMNVETILFIESLEIKNEVNLLDGNGGFHIYLGDNFHRVASYDKDLGFNDFMEMRDINAIIVTNELKNDSRFKGDEEWEFFIGNHQARGFEKLSIPDIDREFFVKKELIN